MSVGTQIAGYRLEEEVGHGGMGVVYRAEDVALERPVALKLLAPSLAEDPAFRERFLVESRLAASLDHPNVVPIYDAGEVEGQLYLAMRYVEGSDLKERLREGPLDRAEAVAITEQVARALDAAHARGLVHRDVKPSNVLLDEQGHAYLADFGLTRRLQEQAPGFEAGLSLGTPSYVAPEQIESKEIDGRADQYSLACLLHECLTGKPPFPRGSEAATLFAHLEEPPPAPSGLEQVLPKALAKDPVARYASCSAFVSAARQALGLEPKRVRWPLALAGAGAVVVGTALLAFFVTRGPSPAAAHPALNGRLVRIASATGKVESATPIRTGETDVDAGAGVAWIANPRDGSVTRIAPRTGQTQRIQVAPAGVGPHQLAASAGGVWLVNQGDSSVRFYHLRTHNFDLCSQASSSLPSGASLTVGQVAVYRSALWVTAPDGQRVLRYADACSRPEQVVSYADLPLEISARGCGCPINPFEIAVGEGAVWVAAHGTRPSLIRVDGRTRRVTRSVRTRFEPSGLAAGAGSVWLGDYAYNVVYRFDPSSLQVTAKIKVGRGPIDVAFANGSAWVLNSIDGTVSRIDPRSGRVDTIDVGDNVHDLAAGHGSVWVTRTETSG